MFQNTPLRQSESRRSSQNTVRWLDEHKSWDKCMYVYIFISCAFLMRTFSDRPIRRKLLQTFINTFCHSDMNTIYFGNRKILASKTENLVSFNLFVRVQ